MASGSVRRCHSYEQLGTKLAWEMLHKRKIARNRIYQKSGKNHKKEPKQVWFSIYLAGFWLTLLFFSISSGLQVFEIVCVFRFCIFTFYSWFSCFSPVIKSKKMFFSLKFLYLIQVLIKHKKAKWNKDRIM